MTRLQFVAAIVCAALVLWGSDARAATSEPRIALVVGNAAYRNAPPLKNPVNDAQDIAKALRDLGFDVIQVENASKQQLEHAIGEFSAKLTEGSVGLFYYSGHGIQENGRNFLIPVDANLATEAAVRLEAVEVDLVLDLMNLAQTRVNLVILDACRSNPFERRFRSIGRGLAPVEQAPRGTLVAYSTAPGKVASDGDGPNGLYTAELLRAIRVPGLKVEEVFKTVRIAVSKASHDYQTPWESSSLTGDFFFSPLALPVSPTRPMSADAAVWDVIKDGSDPESVAVFLKNYPNSEFAPLAQKRLASLKVRPEQPAPQGEETSGAASSSQIRTSQVEPATAIQSSGPLETKPLRSKPDVPAVTLAVVPPDPKPPTPSPQQITQAQSQLTTLGYFSGQPDGKASAKTANAVKEFQRDQHLKVDGEIDQQLLQHLEAAVTLRAQQSAQEAEKAAQAAQKLIDAGIDAYDQRRAEEAIQTLRAGIEIHDDARAEFYLGEAYRSTNNDQSARGAYAKAAELAPDSRVGAEAKSWVAWLRAKEISANTSASVAMTKSASTHGFDGRWSADFWGPTFVGMGCSSVRFQLEVRGTEVTGTAGRVGANTGSVTGVVDALGHGNIKWASGEAEVRFTAYDTFSGQIVGCSGGFSGRRVVESNQKMEASTPSSSITSQQVAIAPIPSTVNPASQPPQSAALAPPVPSASLAISAETLKKLAVPLDGGMIIEFQKPAPNVGQEYAAFVGAWTGNWNSFLPANLFIESVSITGDVRGIYQWGTNRNIKEPGIISFQGKIVNGVLSWKSSNTSLEFTLQADGKMAGKHFRAKVFDFSIVMAKLQ